MFDDYLMDQINGASRALAKLICSRKAQAYELMDEQLVVSGEGLLWYELNRLILQGEINEAENLLFEKIRQTQDQKYAGVAMQFYQELAKLNPVYLKQRDFSPQEILEGLEEVKRIYGLNETTP